MTLSSLNLPAWGPLSWHLPHGQPTCLGPTRRLGLGLGSGSGLGLADLLGARAHVRGEQLEVEQVRAQHTLPPRAAPHLGPRFGLASRRLPASRRAVRGHGVHVVVGDGDELVPPG